MPRQRKRPAVPAWKRVRYRGPSDFPTVEVQVGKRADQTVHVVARSGDVLNLRTDVVKALRKLEPGCWLDPDERTVYDMTGGATGIVQYIGAQNPHSEEINIGGYQNFLINCIPGEVLTLPQAVCNYLVGLEPNWWTPSGGWTPPAAGPQTGYVAWVYSAYTVLATNGVVIADPTSGGSFVVTLPDATTVGGQNVTLKHSGSAHTVTIDPASAQTIGTASSFTLNAGEAVELYSDGGTSWRVLSSVALSELPGPVENASQSVAWMPIPSGDTTGATDTANFTALLNALPVSTEAGSVGYPQGTIQLAQAPQSNPYYFGNLPNAGPHVDVIGRGVRSTFCYHANATAGPMFRFYSSWFEAAPYPVPYETTRGGGACLDMCIDGTNAVAASVGLEYGDMIGFRHRVTARHYNGTGSIGLWQKTMVKCTEKVQGDSYIYDCTTHFKVSCEFADDTTTVAAAVTLPATTVTLAGVLPPSWANPYGPAGTTAQIYVNAQAITYAGVTENGNGTFTLTGCSGGTGNLTVGMTVQNGSADPSHGYCSNRLRIGAMANQDTVTITNGAQYYNGELTVRGNMQTASSAQSTALLNISGATPTGLRLPAAEPELRGGVFEVAVENDGSGTYSPLFIDIMRAGSGEGLVAQNVGTISLSGTATWSSNLGAAPSSLAGKFRHFGFITGDLTLNPDTGTNPGPIVRGPLRYQIAYMNNSAFMLEDDGDFASLVLSANVTVSFNNLTPGAQRKIIKFSQPSSGGTYNYTVTWPTNGSPTTSSPNVAWPGGTAPVMSTGAGATDVYEIISFDGAHWYATAVAQNALGGTQQQIVDMLQTPKAATASAWNYQQQSASYGDGYITNSSSDANNDSVTFYAVKLDAGTWQLDLFGYSGTDGAFIYPTLVGPAGTISPTSSPAYVDQYAASAGALRTNLTGFAVTEPGLYSLVCTVNGRNASNTTGYKARIGKGILTKTA